MNSRCFYGSSSYVVLVSLRICQCLLPWCSSSQLCEELGSDLTPPRITSNVKQNLQFLKLWKEFQKQKSSIPKPATSYRRKKMQKDELPEDTEFYRDPTMNLYYTNQSADMAVPVLLVDGYNVCGYWMKLKKHFMNGRLDIARQKLIDELITFTMLRGLFFVSLITLALFTLSMQRRTYSRIHIVDTLEKSAKGWSILQIKTMVKVACVKVVVVFDAMIRTYPEHGVGFYILTASVYFSLIKGIEKELQRDPDSNGASQFLAKFSSRGFLKGAI
ncbi:hypothetical protein HHK36_008881 [Tetracentron sinense]|uniref:Uncharacterized protein n=1 Tax=Tetracentron sinense TaxID=13715 RepID=A0A834ZE92_TETSI|nr:hypothetical protein HHK36_008881 [Tetracentron sinense]